MCEKQTLHFVQTFFVACCFIVVVSMIKMHHFGHACHGTRLKSAISLGSVSSRFTQGIGHVYRDLCPGGCGLSTFDLQVDFAPSTRNLSVQSTLRPPEVNMFYRNIRICIAYMGVDHVRTSCLVAKRNGSVFNTVTLTASLSTRQLWYH